MGVWGDDRTHCPACNVGLGRDEPCPIPACPAYGMTGFDAVWAADRTHPAALSVARRVAAGTARPGQVLGASDDLAWQRGMRGAVPAESYLDRYERAKAAAEAAAEYRDAYNQVKDDAELADDYERMFLRHIARPS